VVGIIRSLFLQVRNYSLVVIGMGLAVIITAAIIKVPAKKVLESSEGEAEAEDETSIPDPDGEESLPDEKEEEETEPADPKSEQDSQEPDNTENSSDDGSGTDVE
jgi:hypothetical protein